MPLFAAAGCRVLAPDMRGYGDSAKPEGSDGYDGRALAEEARALVRTIGFGDGRPLTLVAHDMGAPGALLWAADHPDEIALLAYLEEPVLLPDLLAQIIAYTPAALAQPMWWWLLPLAGDAPERLVVGNERAFLEYFYDRGAARREAIEPAAVDEYLRTFSGREGVLGAMGIYRAALETAAQTAPLAERRIGVPVVALGGERARGASVRANVERVASRVAGGTIPGAGHYLPEEAPREVVDAILRAL